MNDDRLYERARKIFALAERAGTPEEAATAASKLQEFLVAHNLDMATVEQGGDSGKREDARVRGGMYQYERDLWRAVAELNFCMYFPTKQRTLKRPGLTTLGGEVLRLPTYQMSFYHRVIGKTVNTTTTKTMTTYLSGAIERLCRERLGDEGRPDTQYYSAWGLAFREGAADLVVDKLRERRQHMVDEETRKTEAAARAATKMAGEGVSTSTALTIGALTDKEEQANYDFLHGEGAWARREARIAEREKRWAEERAAQAKIDAEADRIHAEWAREHPEEAAKAERKAAAEDRRRWARYRGPRDRQPTARERRGESGAFYSGRAAAEKIGLDPQVDKSQQRRLGNV